MINSSLRAFAATVQQAGCISSDDAQRLQRDLFPNGISSRDEAELLLTLDRTVGRADPAFADWLVAMLVDLVVWGTRPTGRIDADTAAWLMPFIAGPSPTRTMRRLARDLAHETGDGDDALRRPALKDATQHLGSATVSLEPVALAA